MGLKQLVSFHIRWHLQELDIELLYLYWFYDCYIFLS